MDVFTGKGVSHGIAFGIISVLQSANASVDESPAEDPEKEWAFFIKAKKQADEELAELFETTRREIGEKEAMIIDVQRMMLDDGDFNDAVSDLIHNGRKRAAAAAALAGKQFSEFFAGLDDPYMRARSADVADVSKRLVRLLTGGEQNQHEMHEPYVLLAEDLSPSETLQLDKSFLQAIVTKGGTENSHAVILARALNLPCVIQADLPDPESLQEPVCRRRWRQRKTVPGTGRRNGKAAARTAGKMPLRRIEAGSPARTSDRHKGREKNPPFCQYRRTG
jgi:phosphoenolpyruvate-protein phosphotransferase (PTS system enzyme I)